MAYIEINKILIILSPALSLSLSLALDQEISHALMRYTGFTKSVETPK